MQGKLTSQTMTWLTGASKVAMSWLLKQNPSFPPVLYTSFPCLLREQGFVIYNSSSFIRIL